MSVPKSISEDEKVLSTSDVAKRLGVHRSTVWLWIKQGMLISEKHGSFHGVKPAALKRFQSMYQIGSEAK